MQLPLSASALVMLGVGAVLVGALILVVELVRRRKPASGPTRVPPDMRMPQPPVATSGPYAAVPPAAGPQVPPHVPSMEPASAPAEREPEPAAPPVPQPLAAPAAAAATSRPAEVSAMVDPPGGEEQGPPAWTPPARTPATPSRHHQAGSGRTVAAAVAQAFAVRAAASRAGASGPGVQRPDDPPPSDEGAAAAQGSAAPPPEPERDEQVATEDVPTHDLDGADPAATTDPEGVGLAAVPMPGPEVPEQGASGNGWAASVAHGTNGDRPAETPEPEARQAPEPAAGSDVPATAGLLAAGWTVPAAPVPPAPESAPVPVPRSDTDGVDQQHAPSPDARDRLLAVLLDDPERAVGATVELESCLRELDRLTDAVRTGRAALRDVLHRLTSAGLRPDQLARLARLPQAEVEELLQAAPAEQQA